MNIKVSIISNSFLGKYRASLDTFKTHIIYIYIYMISKDKLGMILFENI